jgi:hypothetical protein
LIKVIFRIYGIRKGDYQEYSDNMSFLDLAPEKPFLPDYAKVSL